MSETVNVVKCEKGKHKVQPTEVEWIVTGPSREVSFLVAGTHVLVRWLLRGPKNLVKYRRVRSICPVVQSVER